MCYRRLFDRKSHSNILLVYIIHTNLHHEPFVCLLEPQVWLKVNNVFLVSPVQKTRENWPNLPQIWQSVKYGSIYNVNYKDWHNVHPYLITTIQGNWQVSIRDLWIIYTNLKCKNWVSDISNYWTFLFVPGLSTLTYAFPLQLLTLAMKIILPNHNKRGGTLK